MVIHSEKLSGTASSGTFAVNTTTHLHGMCMHILANPATSSTTYDLKVVNPNSMTVYEVLSQAGELSEMIEIPLRGTHTITISNASADELFNIELLLVDKT